MKLLLKNLSALRIAHSALFIALAPSAMMADTTYTWQKQSGAGTGGTDWTSWDDTANWSGGNVPASASDSIADLTAASGQYIALPSSALALKQINMSSTPASFPVLRGDSTVTFHRELRYVYLYAPWSISASSQYAGPRGVQFCGPAQSIKGLPLCFGENHFRFDLYATQAGNVRSENAWRTGDGYMRGNASFAFTFIAPHGSDSDITANWSLTEGSPFLSRAVGQSEHVLSVGTTVTGTGIPAGTWLKRVFPDGTIELSASATETSSSTPLTFAAFNAEVTATFPTIACYTEGYTTTLRVQKYRDEDDIVVSFGNLNRFNASHSFKISTEAGFIPGVAALSSVDKKSQSDVPVTLENCHVRIAGDALGDAKFSIPDAAHTARVSVVTGETRHMGTLATLKGTFVKDGQGTLGVDLSDTAANYTGTLVVDAGTLAITNAGVFVARVVVKNGATLDAPNGLHVGSLEADEGAVVKGGRFYVDTPDFAAFGRATFKGAYMLDATPSGRQLEITLVTGSMERAKLGNEFVSEFSADSLIRVDGSGEVEVLLVGGGGGGGTMWGGGGGGGGVVHREHVLLTNGWYGVAVGAGGHGASAKAALNTSGGDSMFYGITAFGGGAGGTWYTAKDEAGNTRGGSNQSHIGVAGASGGGGGIMYYGAGANRSASGGAGTEGQGFDGGYSFNWCPSGSSAYLVCGGGGGGAAAAGQDAATNSVNGTWYFSGACGGDGIACSITGQEIFYGGGGAGSGNRNALSGSVSARGGAGGGGNGSFAYDTAASPGGDGTDGLGGGGAGGRARYIDADPGLSGRGGNGGRGVVILRYARPVEATMIVLR